MKQRPFFHQDAPTPQTHDCGRLPATNMVTKSDSLRRFSWVRSIRLGADEQEFPPEWRVAATGWGNTCTPPVHAARLRSDLHRCIVSRRLCLCNSLKKITNNFFEHHAKLFTHACCSFCPPSPPLKEPPPTLVSCVFHEIMNLWQRITQSIRCKVGHLWKWMSRWERVQCAKQSKRRVHFPYPPFKH